MEELLKSMIESNKVQQQIQAGLLEEQRRANNLKIKELEMKQAQDVSRIRASDFIPKMGECDDVEAYLHAFETTAFREKWPKDQWAKILAPFLSGESQKAFLDLDPTWANNYDSLKKEMLSRSGLTEFGRAQRYHAWCFKKEQPPRTQMHELMRLAKKWLEPGRHSATEVVDSLVMDRFLRALPIEAKRFVCLNNPSSPQELIEEVERYQASAEMLNSRSPTSAQPQQKFFQRTSTPRWPSPQGKRSSQQDLPVESPLYKPRTCYKCGEVGHISWQCNQTDEPMPTAESSSGLKNNLFAALLGNSVFQAMTCPVSVNSQDVEALLDSGSMITLVHQSLVNPKQVSLENPIPVSCVHGDTCTYPTSAVTLVTTRGKYEIRAGVVGSLPVQVLIGRDCPVFHMLWQDVQARRTRETQRPRGKNRQNMLDYASQNVQTLTHHCLPVQTRMNRGNTLEETESASEQADEPPPQPITQSRVQLQTEPEELGASQESNSGPEAPGHQMLTGQYGTAQLNDCTLVNALKNVKVIDGIVQSNLPVVYPHFAIKNGLLYQIKKEGEETIEQLLVPQTHRATVLQLAHTHLLGAHLGVDKTKERVLQRFFWPGVHKEVENYCRSCPECQQSAPKPNFRSPLIPLPIIETPFERIGMDIVGPLPRSGRGHQYILVMVDYATRYPEAVPLRKATSKQIAKELFLISTRVGIPKEILTDQGTPFMSRVMKELCALLKIKQIRTSVYHPQTDGLVERFNKTLKQMLRKTIDTDGKNWDQLLPYLLFSIREVPQASTGFAPFELLYPYKPRGLLDIAKEAWEEQPCPHRSFIEHVGQMRDRMAAIYPIVREHMEKAQREQQAIYNRPAQPREFQPGDRVLVLVPTVECKFLATWQGPFEVIERVGEVNYRVKQTGKRKPDQIYHVNLLKRWHPREVMMCSLSPSKPSDPPREEVRVSPDLNPQQKQEVLELVDRNKDVFSIVPGHTQMIQHEIQTVPGKIVQQRPYRIPEARREAIKEEVREMLRLGVIEESQSAWSSPIVMVPKPDGTIRFCNDFRKLNEISKFDAYPMPHIDELIDRLGKARFISTLDLTKGYWQVPLSSDSKEKTAFATPDGLYHYTHLPFGLHGAPATFQRLMNRVLQPHQQYAAAYLDDVVIHSSDWESHLGLVQKVLDSLREAGLTANPKKCKIAYGETEYLGYTIGRGVVQPQEAKVGAIQNWPRPQTKRQVKSFLGLANYYRRFVPNFSSLVAPITELTTNRYSRMVKWSKEAEEAFSQLKRMLCSRPILKSPDFTKEFLVQTDASEAWTMPWKC
ncbi:uncharacterized protein [Misgurnus anguillicaudatus]|uniref:uncharacterized protein n=1 Tax=Misgurnus anguillicaudatus TaxID=75329 RepID=UPI003CCF8ED9